MKLIDKIMLKLGYQKVAQAKPSAYPDQTSIPLENDNNNQLLNPNKMEQTIEKPQPATQLNLNTPSVHLEGPGGQGEAKDMSQVNQNVAPSEFSSPTNEKPSNVFMDNQEVDALNPILGAKMKKAGILRVDRKMFMEKYNNMVKNAACKKIPLSDYIDGRRE